MKTINAEIHHLSDIASSRQIRTSDFPAPARHESWLATSMREGKAPECDEFMVERATITPDEARHALQFNAENNRRLSQEHLSKIIKDLQTGHWDFRADVIRFSKKGKLIDGQHRMMAIAKSGTPAESLIAYGLDEHLIRKIDTTLRSRSYADGLRVDGAKYPNKLAAAAAVLKNIDTEEFSSRKRPNDFENDAMIALHAEGLEWALAQVPARIEPGIQAGAKEIYSAFAYLYPVDPEKIEALKDAYVHEGAPLGHPMNTLRRTVANFRKETPRVRLMKVLRCIEAGLEGEQLKLVRTDEGVFERVRKLREDKTRERATKVAS